MKKINKIEFLFCMLIGMVFGLGIKGVTANAMTTNDPIFDDFWINNINSEVYYYIEYESNDTGDILIEEYNTTITLQDLTNGGSTFDFTRHSKLIFDYLKAVDYPYWYTVYLMTIEFNNVIPMNNNGLSFNFESMNNIPNWLFTQNNFYDTEIRIYQSGYDLVNAVFDRTYSSLYVDKNFYPNFINQQAQFIEIRSVFTYESDTLLNYGLQSIGHYVVDPSLEFNTTINTIQAEKEVLRQQMQATIDDLRSQLSILNSELALLRDDFAFLNSSYLALQNTYENYLNNSVGLPQLLFAYTDIPIKVIKGFLGFELFGVQLFDAMTGIITMVLVLWLLKKFL